MAIRVLFLLSFALMANVLPRHVDLALTGATLFLSSDTAPIRDGVILIANGKIVAAGRGSQARGYRAKQTIDCSGLFITAGFWNSHIHLGERKWAKAEDIPSDELSRQLHGMLTRYGFTSVFDLGSPWDNTRRIRSRIDANEVQGPKLRSTGHPLIPAGSPPLPDFIFSILPPKSIELTDSAQAAEAARRTIETGVDGIKIYASRPAVSESVIRAVVEEAHRAKRPVFVHCNTAEDIQKASNAGADVVVHTTPGLPWAPSTLAAMKANRVAFNPTLHVFKYQDRHDRISVQDKNAATTIGQLRDWVSLGGEVIFGTDIGAVDTDPAEEYAMMAEAGMSFPQILASVTTTPAERLGGPGESGKIEVGQMADLVALSSDPSGNVRALADVAYTLRAGKLIYQAARRSDARKGKETSAPVDEANPAKPTSNAPRRP